METDQGAGDQGGEQGFFRWAIPLLWLIVILSAVFAILIFITPLDEYRLFGNFFEAAFALCCMACCLHLYRTVSNRLILLLAAFAFFSYALSTLFWYLYTIALGRQFVFTTVAEFGFLCFFFFFIAAISIEFPDRGTGRSTFVVFILLFLTIPVAAGSATGFTQPVHLALVIILFLVIGLLVTTAIRHGVHHYTVLWAGIGIYCIAWMLYGIRETIFVVYPVPLFPETALTASLTAYDFLSVIGPMIICSQALIQIGLISYITGRRNIPAGG
jgi:hypothetical protein